MGFFDEYTDTSGVEWAKSAEKSELIAEGTTLQVVSAGFRQGKFGPEYFVLFTIPEDEDETTRGMSFTAGSVESRDRMFDQLIEFLANGGEPPRVKLALAGRSQVLKEA